MIDIIAVTYGQNQILKCFINSIKSQTSDKWKLFIIHDGPNEKLKKELIEEKYITDKVLFIEHPERTRNYGHKLRSWALENLVEHDRVLLTNGDNYYVPKMVEEICMRDEDFIYFDMIHSYQMGHRGLPPNHNKSSYGYLDCKLEFGKIDMGSVVIKSKIAKSVGFKDMGHAADWKYFESAIKECKTFYKIDKILFVHN